MHRWDCNCVQKDAWVQSSVAKAWKSMKQLSSWSSDFVWFLSIIYVFMLCLFQTYKFVSGPSFLKSFVSQSCHPVDRYLSSWSRETHKFWKLDSRNCRCAEMLHHFGSIKACDSKKTRMCSICSIISITGAAFCKSTAVTHLDIFRWFVVAGKMVRFPTIYFFDMWFSYRSGRILASHQPAFEIILVHQKS